ncbi:MAG: PAS domain S-box protein [Methanofollis sp.]|uniref:PAS domain S-box protein n=1 Tax=Methanofollis sp. TaxID=2052835 RepID=UPI002607EAA0|nr:PAS domain S-box protein [Methanofollis sp.]MDD4253783.1 PAS domain S-box protein [Methanofollis sp.]
MYSVLYVDDEPALLDIGRLFLERSGHLSVDTALSAAEAIAMMQAGKYDGVIADYQMPGMDGIELLKHIRTHFGELPFILFTGRGREEVVIEALNSGADFYLQKGGDPVSQFAELEHKIKLAIERKQTRDELAESRRRMADVINFLPDATFAIDLDGTVIAWNRAMEEMTGVRSEEILGKGDFEYGIPFYGERRPVLIDLVLKEGEDIETKYPRVVQSGTKLISEFFLPHLYDGRGAYLWFIASPLYDTKGNVTGAIESIRDVTERKKAEEETEAAHQKLLDIVDFLPDATFVIDRGGRVIAWNRAIEEMTGARKEEMLGKGDHAYAVPFYGKAISGLIDLVMKPEAEPEVQYEMFRREGDTVVAEMTIPSLNRGRGASLCGKASPLYDSRGEIIGAIESLRDITGYKQAESARLHAIARGSPIPQFVIDRNHRVVYWNGALEAYSGIKTGDIVGTNEHWRAFYPRERPCLADLLIDGEGEESMIARWYKGKYAPSGLVRGAYEATDFFPTLGEDGTWLYFTAALIRDEEGEVIGAVETLEDVTERKQAEERIRIFQRFTEASGQGLGMATLDGSITYANPTLCRLLGMAKPVEIQDTFFFRYYSPEIAERLEKEIIPAVLEEGQWVGELTLVNAQGEHIPTIENFFVIPDDFGRPLYLADVITDISGLKKAEEALKASEDRYRTLFENSGSPLIIVEEDTTISLVNREFEKISGCTKEDVEDRMRWTDFVADPAELERLMEYHRLRWTESESAPRVFECHLCDRYGTVRNVLVTAAMMPGARQSIVAIVDITERKKAEEARHLADLIHSMPDAIFAVDRDGKVIAWNRAIEEMTGVAAAEIIGKGEYAYAVPFFGDKRPLLLDLVSAPAGELERRGYTRIARSGDFLIAESADARPQGREVILQAFAAPLYDESGENIGAIEGIHDITDLRHAEQALQESEIKYRSLFEYANDAIILILDDRITDCNPRALEMFGCTRDEFVGSALSVFSPPVQPDGSDSKEKVAEKIRGAIAGEAQFFECNCRTHDRRPFYAEVSLNRIQLGDEISVQAIVRDITARRDAEEALKKKTYDLNERVKELKCLYTISKILGKPETGFDALMQTVVDVIPDAWQYPEVTAARITLDGRVYQTAAFQKTAWMQRQPILVNDREAGTIEVGYREERPERNEGPFLKEERSLIASIAQRIGGYIVRKQAEEALSASETELRAVLSGMTDIVVVLDAEGHCLKVAPTNPPPLFRPAGEVCGKTLDRVFPSMQAETIPGAILQALETGEPVAIEYGMRVRNQEVWFAAVISPMTEDLVVLVARNITGRKQAETAIQTANKKLNLLSSITRHDILNQITVLRGYIELARMETTDPTLLDYITREETATWAIQRQIEFTRDYQNIGVTSPQWQDVHRVIARAVRGLDLGRVEFSIDFDEVEVYADPLLEKVFFNLVDNALRYGEKLTKIRFSGREDEGGFTIVCEDDGVGIPTKVKEAIFRREYYKNTGLGLYLSREILAITDLTITETGEHGRGARFEVFAPRGVYRSVTKRERLVPPGG